MSQQVVSQPTWSSGVRFVEPSGYVGESSPYVHGARLSPTFGYGGTISRRFLDDHDSFDYLALTPPSAGMVFDRIYEIAQELFNHIQWLASMDGDEIVINKAASRKLTLRVVRTREPAPLIVKDDF